MEGIYGVSIGNQLVGKVQVLHQGLYYRFICRCQITGDIIFRLMVNCNEKQENLGILIPVSDGFGVDTKIPTKRLGNGELNFYLKPKHESSSMNFAPIYPEEPFSYISHLKDAFLERKNGLIGICIMEKAGK